MAVSGWADGYSNAVFRLLDRDRDMAGRPTYERVNCGVCFENVTSVQRYGLDQK